MPAERVCIACDNRHGCLSPDPPCHAIARVPGETGLRGLDVMARRGLLDACRCCAFFRQCWGGEEHRAAQNLNCAPKPKL